MASLVNQDCSQAVLRFLDRVDMGAIHSIVEGIPNTAYDLPIITNSQKQCYIRMLKTALDALLKPIAKRITEKGIY